MRQNFINTAIYQKFFGTKTYPYKIWRWRGGELIKLTWSPPLMFIKENEYLIALFLYIRVYAVQFRLIVNLIKFFISPCKKISTKLLIYGPTHESIFLHRCYRYTRMFYLTFGCFSSNSFLDHQKSPPTLFSIGEKKKLISSPWGALNL